MLVTEGCNEPPTISTVTLLIHVHQSLSSLLAGYKNKRIPRNRKAQFAGAAVAANSVCTQVTLFGIHSHQGGTDLVALLPQALRVQGTHAAQ